MPLTSCPDCGLDVSTLAKACPGCGRPRDIRSHPQLRPALAIPLTLGASVVLAYMFSDFAFVIFLSALAFSVWLTLRALTARSIESDSAS